MPLDENELSALISLLEDPDEEVYTQVKDKLLEFGPEVIPLLENAWEENSFGVLFQNRVEEIVHAIQCDNVFDALQQWARKGGQDLLEGMLIIARYQYPDLDEEAVIDKLNQVQQDIWIELNNNLTALEKVKVMNHIFFEVHGFIGNTTNYHAPQNSYINSVLESHKGNPISLAVLYILVATKLDLPIYGVNLPRHFILCYVDRLGSLSLSNAEEQQILFYINPFSRGTVLSKREVEHFLKQLKLEKKKSYFQPCTNLDVVTRVLNNIIYSYEKLGYPDKVGELKRLAQALSS